MPIATQTGIAGIDEAGRGAWAGPVVAACVLFPNGPIPGLADSKLLSPKRREELYDCIYAHAAVGVGIVHAEVIDQIGIRGATFQAMREAFAACPTPEHVLIDGRDGFPFPHPHTYIVRGDMTEYQISAASIVAKVTRDRYMVHIHHQYPQYDFASHKGYGTKVHQQALRLYGPLPLHRYTYRPVLALAGITRSSIV